MLFNFEVEVHCVLIFNKNGPLSKSDHIFIAKKGNK